MLCCVFQVIMAMRPTAPALGGWSVCSFSSGLASRIGQLAITFRGCERYNENQTTYSNVNGSSAHIVSCCVSPLSPLAG